MYKAYTWPAVPSFRPRQDLGRLWTLNSKSKLIESSIVITGIVISVSWESSYHHGNQIRTVWYTFLRLSFLIISCILHFYLGILPFKILCYCFINNVSMFFLGFCVLNVVSVVSKFLLFCYCYLARFWHLNVPPLNIYSRSGAPVIKICRRCCATS